VNVRGAEWPSHCPNHQALEDQKFTEPLSWAPAAGTILCFKGGTPGATDKFESDGRSLEAQLTDMGFLNPSGKPPAASYILVYETPPPPPNVGGGIEGYICGDPRLVLFLPEGEFRVKFINAAGERRVFTKEGPRTVKRWVKGKTMVVVWENGERVWSIWTGRKNNIGPCWPNGIA
jgi:hypothetical protein